MPAQAAVNWGAIAKAAIWIFATFAVLKIGSDVALHEAPPTSTLFETGSNLWGFPVYPGATKSGAAPPTTRDTSGRATTSPPTYPGYNIQFGCTNSTENGYKVETVISTIIKVLEFGKHRNSSSEYLTSECSTSEYSTRGSSSVVHFFGEYSYSNHDSRNISRLPYRWAECERHWELVVLITMAASALLAMICRRYYFQLAAPVNDPRPLQPSKSLRQQARQLSRRARARVYPATRYLFGFFRHTTFLAIQCARPKAEAHLIAAAESAEGFTYFRLQYPFDTDFYSQLTIQQVLFGMIPCIVKHLDEAVAVAEQLVSEDGEEFSPTQIKAQIDCLNLMSNTTVATPAQTHDSEAVREALATEEEPDAQARLCAEEELSADWESCSDEEADSDRKAAAEDEEITDTVGNQEPPMMGNYKPTWGTAEERQEAQNNDEAIERREAEDLEAAEELGAEVEVEVVEKVEALEEAEAVEEVQLVEEVRPVEEVPPVKEVQPIEAIQPVKEVKALKEAERLNEPRSEEVLKTKINFMKSGNERPKPAQTTSVRYILEGNEDDKLPKKMNFATRRRRIDDRYDKTFILGIDFQKAHDPVKNRRRSLTGVESRCDLGKLRPEFKSLKQMKQAGNANTAIVSDHEPISQNVEPRDQGLFSKKLEPKDRAAIEAEFPFLDHTTTPLKECALSLDLPRPAWIGRNSERRLASVLKYFRENPSMRQGTVPAFKDLDHPLDTSKINDDAATKQCILKGVSPTPFGEGIAKAREHFTARPKGSLEPKDDKPSAVSSTSVTPHPMYAPPPPIDFTKVNNPGPGGSDSSAGRGWGAYRGKRGGPGRGRGGRGGRGRGRGGGFR